MVKNHNYKIGTYLRVSTEEQTLNPEGSIKNQEQRLRDAINYRNQNSNFGELVGVYTDAGISAKDMNRPELHRLLKAVKAKEINLIMVTELSRLSRNNRDFLQMWDMMRDFGCSFMSLREDFDTTTAAGEMLLFQLVNFAQFERKTTSERVSANILARSKRGLYNGGSIPLGYRKNPISAGRLEIDPESVEIVRTAFDAFLREGSLSRAAKWLNDNGHKARLKKDGGGSRMRLGHFTVDNLQKMIRNKIYIGIKVYSERSEWKEVTAAWDGIIDEAKFYRANEQLTRNKSRYKPITAESKYPYILSGVSFCMTCGDFMPGRSATGRNGKVPYYEHSWATKRESCLSKKTFKCDPHRVQAKKLEPLVWEEFCRFLDKEEFVLGLMARVRKLHADNDGAKEHEKLKSKLYGLNSQLEALAERIAILPKTLSPGLLFKQMEKIESHKKDIEEQLLKVNRTDVEKRLVPLETFSAFAHAVRKILKEDPDMNLRKTVLQKFVKRIEVGMDSVKIFWNLDKDFYDREMRLDVDLREKEFAQATKAWAGALLRTDYGSQSLTNGAR